MLLSETLSKSDPASSMVSRHFRTDNSSFGSFSFSRRNSTEGRLQTDDTAEHQQIELKSAYALIQRNSPLSALEALKNTCFSILKGDFRDFSKNLLYLLIGCDKFVEGLGIKISGLEKMDLKALNQFISKVDYSALDTDQRLSLSAISGKLQLALRHNLQDSNIARTDSSRTQVIEYLKATAKPGDIVFFSTGGKREKLITEIAEIISRWKSEPQLSDQKLEFPFVHVGVVTECNRVVHMTSKGQLIDGWEKLIAPWRPYDTIGLGRLEIPEAERLQLAAEALKFSTGKKYNSFWPFKDFFLKVVLQRKNVADDSVKTNSAICIDLISEACKKLKSFLLDPKNGILSASTALDIFKAEKHRMLVSFQISDN